MIEFLKSFLFGIVEGITEWLPISSTGHMILVDEFIKLNVPKDFMEMFLVVIQLGAILAVCVIYFHKLNPFSPKKSAKEKRETVDIWGKVIVGCLPAAVIGLAFNDKIDALFYNAPTVAFTLILYGILFIIVENYNKHREPQVGELSDLTYKIAVIIGCFQVLALIPGTSRSGATIIGAMILGTSRFVAAEYSFFLSIPVMFGASFLKLVKYGFHYTADIRQIRRLNGWAPDEVSGLELQVDDYDHLDRIAEDLYFDIAEKQDRHGNTYYTRSIKELNPMIFDWLEVQDINVVVILVLILAVAGFTMISGLLIIILERTNMIGILKALGENNTSIRKIFLYISFFLIGKGMIWGNVIGIVLCLVQSCFRVVKLDPSVYYLDAVPIDLTVFSIVLLNIGTLAAAMLMMLGPSYLITKIHPAKSIRFE